MPDTPPIIDTSRFALAPHRRIGIASLLCAGAGAAWLTLAVLPGLSRSDKKDGSVNKAGIGIFGWGSWFGSPKPASSPSPKPAAPGILYQGGDLIEVAFVNAPAGSALQTVLAAGRFSATQAPSITGTITYRSTGNAKPFWEVFGHVLGAAPSPGLQLVQSFEGYMILPRNITPMESRDQFRRGDGTPILSNAAPVPLGEKPTYRMAGYISYGGSALNGSPGLPNASGRQRYALVESRTPGLLPQWRFLRPGDALERKTAIETARETNIAANIDIAPVVVEIEPDAVILRGGGNKTLRVPLDTVGVPDAFAAELTAAPNTNNATSAATDPLQPMERY